MLLLYLCIAVSILTFPIVALLCWIWFCWAVCYIFTHKDKIRQFRGETGLDRNIEPPATIMVRNLAKLLLNSILFSFHGIYYKADQS